MKLRILFLLMGLTGLVLEAFSAGNLPPPPRDPRPGDIDAAFGGGEGLVTIGGEELFRFGAGIQATKINSVAVDPANGDIFAAGFAKTQNKNFAVWKFNAQGVKDETFGARGAVVTNFGNSTDEEIKVIVLLPNKILVGGALTVNGRKVIGLARYDRSGNLDRTFGQNGNGKRWLEMPAVLGDLVLNDMLVDGDGRIVVAGSAMNAARKPILFLSRLTDLDFDPSFSGNGYLTRDIAISTDEVLNAAALGEDGTIFVCGYGYVDRKMKAALGMFLSDGSGGDVQLIDSDSRLQASFQDIFIDSNGRLVVAGEYDGRFAVARYLPNAAPDRTFGEDGRVETDVMAEARDSIVAISPTAENKIVAVGATHKEVNLPPFAELTFALAQYNSDGTLDDSFGDGGKVTTNIPNSTTEELTAVAITPENKIVTGAAVEEAAVSQGLVVQYLGSVAQAAAGGGALPGGGAAPGAEGAAGGGGGGGEVAAGGGGGGDVPGLAGGGGPAGSGGGGCMLIKRDSSLRSE